MYFKSQYYITYAKYQQMRERVEKVFSRMDDLKQAKTELIDGFKKIIKLGETPTSKDQIKDEKKYKYIVESKAFITSLRIKDWPLFLMKKVILKPLTKFMHKV